MAVDLNNQNPYAAPATFPESETRVRVRSGWLHRLIMVQAFVIVVSLAAEAYEHETIVASGPVFSLVGLAIVVLAYHRRDNAAVAFGGSAIALTLLIVFLINYNSWGPGLLI